MSNYSLVVVPNCNQQIQDADVCHLEKKLGTALTLLAYLSICLTDFDET